jgi:hypothetical protein
MSESKKSKESEGRLRLPDQLSIALGDRLERHFLQWMSIREGHLAEETPSASISIDGERLICAIRAYEENIHRIDAYFGDNRTTLMQSIADDCSLPLEEMRTIWLWWSESGFKAVR